jgi:hypothetical protein
MPTINIELILWVVFLTWHYSLFCGYISDDHATVAQRKDIIPDEEKKDRGESFWVKRFNDGIVLFYLTRIFWKLGCRNKPFPWHLFSLLVHLANVYLLYIFLIPIMGPSAVYACAFWAVNPMLNQNVVWISGRPYIIGTFFALIAMICWDKPYVFIPYYLLAVFTNIGIFFIPIIVYILNPKSWQSVLYLAVLFGIATPFLVWKFNKRFTNGLVIDRDNFNFRRKKLNVFPRIILYYIVSLFFPVKMGWYHQSGFKYNERWEKFNYLTLIGYVVIYLLIFYFKFPGWFFLLGFLPVSNVYATNSFLQDRYVYFFSIGIAMIIAPYLYQYPELFYCAMTFYATRAYSYSRHLKDDELMYRENWRNHPNSDYAVNNLSYFLIQQKKYEEARVVVERGLTINKFNKMLWYNLGITWAATGHFNNDEGKFRFLRALDCWKMCLQLEPRWTKPAVDLKKLIKMLIDNKVITAEKNDSEQGFSISVPNLVGMKELLDGTAKQEVADSPA